MCDEVRYRREVLGLLAHPNVAEVHRLVRTPEPPGHGVSQARFLLRGLECAQADALVTGLDLRLESSVRALASWRHGSGSCGGGERRAEKSGSWRGMFYRARSAPPERKRVGCCFSCAW
jgi:hypothetical protein